MKTTHSDIKHPLLLRVAALVLVVPMASSHGASVLYNLDDNNSSGQQTPVVSGMTDADDANDSTGFTVGDISMMDRNGLGWGLSDATNATLTTGSADGTVWYTQGNLVPGAVNTGNDAYMTISLSHGGGIDFSAASFDMRIGLNAVSGPGGMEGFAHLYYWNGSALNPVGSQIVDSVATGGGLIFRDISFDLSSIPATAPGETIEFRMFFTDNSTLTTKFWTIDSVGIDNFQAVPEPGGAALAMVGLAGLWLRRRR